MTGSTKHYLVRVLCAGTTTRFIHSLIQVKMRSASDMGEGASPFALAAYRMMMSNRRKAVLDWDEDGQAIVIKKKAEVVHVLSQHFGGSNTWLWLRNQLQNHGFRISSGKRAAERDWLFFRHRGFQRAERNMLGDVHCPKAGCKFCKSLAWPRPRKGATKQHSVSYL